MNKCYQLVGIPGSGKSTWINTQPWASTIPVVSTDKFVEQYAALEGKLYSEVFEEYMPVAVRLMANQVLICQANKLDIIWDQTSTTVVSRKKKFNMLPHYEHIAVVFKTPDPWDLTVRLKNRPGKNIPQHVVNDMIENFETPTLEEGFTEIWTIGE